MNKTQPIGPVFHVTPAEKRNTRWASVRFIDDYEVEITRPGRRVQTRTYCLMDMDEQREKRLREIVESAAFETHEYDDWSDRGYEVAVVEHCYKCQPVQNDEPAPRPMYISWMDNPIYYRCAGSY